MLNVEAQRKISPIKMESSIRKNSSTIRTVKEEILYLSKSIELSQYTFEDENGKSKSAEVIRKRYWIDVKKDNKCDTILSIAILKRHILCDCLILVRQYRPTLKSYALEFPARIIEQSITTNIGNGNNNANNGDDQCGFQAMKDLEQTTGFGSAKVKYISPETSVDPELCDSKVKLVSMIIDGDDPIKNNFIHKKTNKKSSKNYQTSINIVSLNNDDDNNNNNNQNNIKIPTTVISHCNDLEKSNNTSSAHQTQDEAMSSEQQNKQILKGNKNSNSQDDEVDDEDEDVEDEEDDIEIIFLPINGLLDRLQEYYNQGTIVDSRVYAFAIGLKKGEKLSQTVVKPENIEIAI